MLNIFITLANRGFDVTYIPGGVRQDIFNCLNKNGYKHAIVQALNGQSYNLNAVPEYWKAKQAGIQQVDFYFSCLYFKDPRSYTREILNKLKNEGVLNNNMVWLDVETSNKSFDEEQDNQQYIAVVLDEMTNILGTNHVGVYSSSNRWISIVGQDWTGASQYKLMYPHYDNWQSFDDFQSFGGWTSPSIKKYQSNQTECEYDINRNYF
ncbi:Glycosyl_hydrolase family 25 protein [Hexamita inflata]|uniref:Glycosyl hydrolase family 25 protein n=1 Tax=Hexamita inflata TaxID=28002 RepID=A0AA86REX4_9EUKA|nr:Glycosyl hydrolase family 25 protein [Hexamita inflata]